MKITILNQMVMALVIGAVSLPAISRAAEEPRDRQEEQKRDHDEKDRKSVV